MEKPTLNLAVKDEWVTVQGPVKKPQKDYMSQIGGGGGVAFSFPIIWQLCIVVHFCASFLAFFICNLALCSVYHGRMVHVV